MDSKNSVAGKMLKDYFRIITVLFILLAMISIEGRGLIFAEDGNYTITLNMYLDGVKQTVPQRAIRIRNRSTGSFYYTEAMPVNGACVFNLSKTVKGTFEIYDDARNTGNTFNVPDS